MAGCIRAGEGGEGRDEGIEGGDEPPWPVTAGGRHCRSKVELLAGDVDGWAVFREAGKRVLTPFILRNLSV